VLNNRPKWVRNLLADFSKLSGVLPPNSTIGIVGGGQLGRMIAVAAARLGFKTIVLEPGVGCPATQVCNDQIVAAYDDPTALDDLSARCDVVTYEFENVSLVAAHRLEQSVPLYPPSMALKVSQDRLAEKQFLQSADVEVADYYNIETSEDLKIALEQFDGGILKTRRFGYDGKGQHVFANGEFEGADELLEKMGGGPFVLEKEIQFVSEFSIIAVRSIAGDITVYDPATNVHENGILRLSTVPASISADLSADAVVVAEKILKALDYVGVIGVEFFETSDGLLVNEFAPRVHNSGHWTREACTTSQFEQHVRAITGLPLGSVDRHADCEMRNLLGYEADDIAAYVSDPDVELTLYGKAEAREGRKMGHLTRLKR